MDDGKKTWGCQKTLRQLRHRRNVDASKGVNIDAAENYQVNNKVIAQLDYIADFFEPNVLLSVHKADEDDERWWVVGSDKNFA